MSRYLSSLLIILLFVSIVRGQFNLVETANMKLVYYGELQSYLVPHVARSFENSLAFHQKLFDYRSREKVSILLHDFWDYGNAGARPVPQNHVTVGIAPYSYDYETNPANERMNSSMNHELVHIVTGDQAASADRFYRSLFLGKVYPTEEAPLSLLYGYLTNPRWHAPRWYLEGISVFLETYMNGGLGRAIGAYDEMVFRSMVRDSSYIYDVVGLESEGTAIDFHVGVNSYLYGTRFVCYLAYRYGTDKLLAWYNRKSGSKSYFASQFKRVYGVSLDHEWSQWIAWEHGFQQANLDSIRQHPTTYIRPVSNRTLGSVSRAFYDDSSHKIYVAIRYPGQTAQLAAIDLDTGRLEKICDIIGAAGFYVSSLAYDREGGAVYFTTNNRNWRNLNVVDLKTGKSKRLIKEVRTGDLVFNPADKSLWGVRHYNGISTLVRIAPPHQAWNQIYSLPYGQDMYDLDISPDGAYLTAAFAEVSGRQRLIRMAIAKLMAGDHEFEELFDFENSNPANFVHSPDGRYLYGSSYYSGVSNIYRYDLEKREMEIRSNCETGFFRPVPLPNDSLIVFQYTGKGFIPMMMPDQQPEFVSAIKFLGNEIASEQPVVRSWTLGSPAKINLDSLVVHRGQYRALGNLRLTSGYPIVEGYKDKVAVGMRLNFMDRFAFSRMDLTAAVTPYSGVPDDELFHIGLHLYYFNWKLSATYNRSDFYDLFGPTKTSRKGYSVGIEYKKALLFDEPKVLDFNMRVAGYAGLERLPDFQNIPTTFDKFLSADFWLDYSFVRQSLGAVDDEKGVLWRLFSRNTLINSEVIPLVFSDLDYGIALPLNHSSLWLRSSAGYSFGERDDPNANFFFGGFGNNYVDYRTEKRYREFYSMPGTSLNSIGGTNYGKLMLEWALPPLRFRRIGFQNLYCRWARLGLFTSGIVTNLDSESQRREVSNLGGQLDFSLVLFSTLKSMFSLGYAVSIESQQRLQKEFMISLKIL